MLRVTVHVLVGEIRDMVGTDKCAACNAKVYGEICPCSWHIHMEADQNHISTPGMRSGMMANMFATLKEQVCVLTCMKDFDTPM